MTPSIGRIVLVPMTPTGNNGADTAPAVITRVWSDTMINVRILNDGPDSPAWRTSVTLSDEAPAELADANGGPAHVAWWPPRV